MKKAISNPYAPSAELLAAGQALEDARQRCRKLVEQVDSSADAAAALEAETTRLTAELSSADSGALVALDASEVSRLDAIADGLRNDLGARTSELARAKARITALEATAPQFDEAVDTKITEFKAAKAQWVAEVKAALSVELRAAAAPLLGVLAKVRSLQATVLRGELRDLIEGAWIPEPQGFFRANEHNMGVNLLKELALELPPLDGEFPLHLKRELSAGYLSHSKYEPLARRRPQPYVRKGWTNGVRDHAIRNATAEQPEPANERTPEPQELNVGLAMVENFGKPAPQVQQ